MRTASSTIARLSTFSALDLGVEHRSWPPSQLAEPFSPLNVP
jgi:hypothetical protein